MEITSTTVIAITIIIKINSHLQMITSRKLSKSDKKSTSTDLKSRRASDLQKRDTSITKA
tara:strand:+ start:143 stop:322 length:180 start_codon:yes stop_codon:yes gene_type:complete